MADLHIHQPETSAGNEGRANHLVPNAVPPHQSSQQEPHPSGSYLDNLVDAEPGQEASKPTSEDDESHEAKLAAIRTQVDTYFSEEKLFRDRFLRKQMKGEENRPIPIKLIAAFHRMRKYRIVDIVKALETSEVVTLLPGKEYIRRAVPLTYEFVAKAKKADKERSHAYFSSLSSSAQGKTTGLEYWYCDAPVTPAEYKDERSMYNPEVKLSLRLTAAVHRYGQARRLHNQEMNIFTSWLRYGGWEQGQKQFSGKDPSDLADMDPLDQALMLTTMRVDADMDDPSEWVVNFEKVTRGYFSSYFEEAVRQVQGAADTAVNVLDNFFNYLLHHDVCPELKDQITATKEVLRSAQKELPHLMTLRGRMPDNFSISMSVLTGGTYHSIFGHDLTFLSNSEFDQDWGQDSRMNVTEARNIARLGLETWAPELLSPKNPGSGFDDEEFCEQVDWVPEFLQRANVRTCHRMGLEVISVERPSESTVERYAKFATNPPTINGKTPVIEPSPVGLLRCRQWSPPTFEEYDLPAGVVLTVKEDSAQEYLLPVEATRLEHIYPGMRIYGSISIVTPKEILNADGGDHASSPSSDAPNYLPSTTLRPLLVFLDQSDNLYPTFYTILLNDLEITNSNYPQSSNLKQTREIVWHDTAQAQKWERSEARAYAMAGLAGESDFEDEEEGEGERSGGGKQASGIPGASGVSTDAKKKKKKKRSKGTTEDDQ